MKTISADKKLLRESSFEVKKVREAINKLNYDSGVRNSQLKEAQNTTSNARLTLPKVNYTNQKNHIRNNSDSQGTYSRHSHDIMPNRIKLQKSPNFVIENQSMGNHVRAHSSKSYDSYSEVARIDAR
jgi:hypothetical protein